SAARALTASANFGCPDFRAATKSSSVQLSKLSGNFGWLATAPEFGPPGPAGFGPTPGAPGPAPAAPGPPGCVPPALDVVLVEALLDEEPPGKELLAVGPICGWSVSLL